MDRRKSLKIIGLSALSATVLVDSCKENPTLKPEKVAAKAPPSLDRTPAEKANDEILINGKIFSDHERKTIAVLSDIIIPADQISGNATGAKVPEFIETIAIDMPQHQTPLKGGLRWLDLQCTKNFQQPFISCTPQQQISIIDQIAYPAKAKPAMKHGVFFLT